MQSSSVSNPALAGLSQAEIIVLNEKANLFTYEGFYFCAPRCVTHFGEDGIPYHYGEKTCLNRCMSKLKLGLEMAVESKRNFQKEVSEQRLPYNWMRKAAQGELDA